MSKKLCDLKKMLKREPQRYLQLVHQPTHVCERCGRVANKKKLLCRPAKLKK